MANWRHKRLLRQAWHPADEELLLHVEGEADPRDARRLADHLSGCWTCRARRAEIERAIGAYMAYHRDPARDAAGEGDDPEQATRRFAAALARAPETARHGDARHAGERTSAPPPSWRFWRTAGRAGSAGDTVAGDTGGGDAPQAGERASSPAAWQWRRRIGLARDAGGEGDRALDESRSRRAVWTLARAAMLVVAVVFFARWWMAPTPVSARELLDRVDRAQQHELGAVADPVVYQKLRVTRADVPAATVTWEVWASQRQRRVVQRGAEGASLLLDLEAVLRNNGMEPGQPLSPASLTAWRRFVGQVSEDVRDTTLADGTSAVTLTSSAPGPVADGRISRSEVTVRTRDWHPVAHVFTVAAAAGQQRYTVTELGYRVVPHATVDAALFTEAAAPAVARAEPAADAAAPRTSASSSSSPALERAAAAVRAQYLRHTSGACVEASGTATQHLFAVRALAEWYRALEDEVVRQGLDAKSAALLATMIRDHLNAARQRLPVSGEAVDIAPPAADSAASAQPWTTVAMKAYAAVEYASRSGDPDAVARARALVDALDRAARQLARGGSQP